MFSQRAAWYDPIMLMLLKDFRLQFPARLRVLFLALSVLLCGLPALAQDGAKRVALLIGNSAYENVPALRNPGNDSADLAAALREVGFEVTLHADQTQASMLDVLRGFRRSASGAEIALIYYAGHGIEINRENYLIPVDAVLETDADINFEAVPLDTMIFAASGAARLSMVIVDACRNNPFAASIQRTSSSRSIGRGLSAVEPSKNTLVAYAAKEGTTAADGAGRNSPYASALIASLRQPGLEVGLMMRQVRDNVLDATGGAQEPFVYGSLSAEQIFLNDARGLTPVQPEDVESPDTGAGVPDATAAEIAFWQSISATSAPAELESYLSLYPDGLFADLARSRLDRNAQVALLPQDPFTALVPGAAAPETGLPDSLPADAAETSDNRDLTRDEITELQERLSVLGHSLGRADGIAGRQTRSAIRAFEQSLSLPVTGLASLSVLLVLREQVSASELASWRASQRTAPTVAVAPARPRATAPAPAPTAVAPAPVAAPSDKYRQFCAANKQCTTSVCLRGTGGEFFRNNRSCKFCPLYAERCG